MRVAFLDPLDQRFEIPASFLAEHEALQSGSPEALPEGWQDAEAIVWTRWPVDRALIESMPRLRLLQRFGRFRAGGDATAALERGIPVSVLPISTSGRVAEHTFALILGLFRGLLRSHQSVVEGRNPAGLTPEERVGPTPTVNWAQVPGLQTLQYKTAGIVGFGEIGSIIAGMLRPFGCRVFYNKRSRLTPEQEAFYGVQYAEFESLLGRSDVVVNLVPVSPATRGMFGEREFGLMKPSAFFVNTGRAATTDEAALVRLLAEGRIAGAGLDVFSLEPLPPGHPLLELPNVLLTPHTAGGTPQGQINGLGGWWDTFERLEENLRRVQAGESVLAPMSPDEPPAA